MEVVMSLYYVDPVKMMRRAMWRNMVDANVDEDVRRVMFPMDVKAGDEAYEINALLPGVTVEELEISIVQDTVTIQGNLKVERSADDRYLMQERPNGKFYRSVQLPDELDADKAEAHLENGVLTLRIPKSEAVRPRTVKVIAS
jgi:HSP20 family protein